MFEDFLVGILYLRFVEINDRDVLGIIFARLVVILVKGSG